MFSTVTELVTWFKQLHSKWDSLQVYVHRTRKF